MTVMQHDSNGSWRRQSVVDEAAHWLAMCSDACAGEAERAAFVAWLRRSNLHVEEFLRLSALTQRVSAAALWPHDSVEDLVARALEAPQIALLAAPGADAPNRAAAPETSAAEAAARRFPVRWAIAAAVTLLVGAAVGLSLGPYFIRDATTYTTAVGEMRSIVLADGSVVELNTQSSLKARFSSKVRLVELERGEAIFRVVKDRARPFRVVVGATEIVAVGTAFNVYAESSRTVVTVLEGRVRVTDRTAPPARANGAARLMPEVELGSGEQAVIAPRQPIARALADPNRVTSWTERRLIFEDAALASVAAEFARYSPRVIRIDGDALAQRHITGVFDASDPASLVQFLGAQGDVTIAQTDEGWSLRGR